MKTAVSIPDEVFHNADKVAKINGFSRSELYARALKDYLERFSDEQIKSQLNAIYAETDSVADPILSGLQAKSLSTGENKWR